MDCGCLDGSKLIIMLVIPIGLGLAELGNYKDFARTDILNAFLFTFKMQ